MRERRADHWILRHLQCNGCWGWTADYPVCVGWASNYAAGLTWLSDGLHFRVVEVACMAMGDEACEFVINKEPEESA